MPDVPKPSAHSHFFELSLDLLCIANTDGFFLELNPAWTRTLGWSESELKAKPFLEFVHPDDRASTLDETAKLARGHETVSFLNRYRCRDGSWKWLRWNTAPTADGKLYAVARDVSETVGLRRELSHQKDLLARTSTLAKVGGWSWTAEGDELSLSGHLRTMFDIGDDEEVDIPLLMRLSAASPEVMQEAFDSALGGGGWDLEYEVLSLGGRRLWVRSIGEAHFDEDGNLAGMSGAVQDITDRRHIDRLKNEFVSTVSHELRTPLTSIVGSLRMLKSGQFGELPPQAAQLVAVGARNSERLVSLVNDILDIEKIEAGQLDLQLKTLPASAVVERALQTVGAFSADRHVEIAVDDGESEAVLCCDADRLAQALINLLSNAVKFAGADRVVTLSVKDVRRPNEETVRFEVSDNGPGLSEEDRERVFEKFRQADSSNSRSQDGTGLGLPIAQQLVAMHGGTIGVESTLNEGSTFWFEVPVADSVKAEKPKGTGRPVLIIEDDPDVAHLLRLLVHRSGFDATSVGSLAEARIALATSTFSAAVLDFVLKDGSGADLLPACATAGTPVVVVSRQAQPATKPNVVAWLAKPVDPSKLAGALRRAVRAPGAPVAVLMADDAGVRASVSRILTGSGVRLLLATGPRECLHFIDEHSPDVLILAGESASDFLEVTDSLRSRRRAAPPLLVYSEVQLSAGDESRLRFGEIRFLHQRMGVDSIGPAALELLGDLL